MSKKQNITLEDIAKKLFVTKVTVSKALRNHPDISTKMIEKVKATANEMGYFPNYAARNLSSQKTNTIGLIVPKIAHFFFANVIEAIYDKAFENNYEVILAVSQENPEREKKHIETMLSMRVDGLIISITDKTQNTDIFNTIYNHNIPLVFFDRIIEDKRFNSVIVSDKKGAYTGVEQAIKLGYKKIAHIAGPQEVNIGRERCAGYLEALKKYSIPLEEKFLITGGFTEQDGFDGFMKIYNAGDLPEFIFTVNYPVALGAYAAIKSVGLSIPDDIDMLCFGNENINRFEMPALSFINQPTKKLGSESTDLMLKLISGEIKDPQKIELDTELVLRDTLIKK